MGVIIISTLRLKGGGLEACFLMILMTMLLPFATECANSVVDAYIPIIEKSMDLSFTNQKKARQQQRRSRYKSTCCMIEEQHLVLMATTLPTKSSSSLSTTSPSALALTTTSSTTTIYFNKNYQSEPHRNSSTRRQLGVQLREGLRR